MAYSAKGSGAIFENQQKESDSHPDFRGSVFFSSKAINDLKEMDCFANPEGAYADVSVWRKTSKNGTEFFSMSIGAATEKEQKYQADKDAKFKSTQSNVTPSSNGPDQEEDIPF